MTDPLEREPKLAEAVRRLVAAYQPERIYLFGSVARGDTEADSDYDLLVVVPDDALPERRDGGLAYRALWGVGTAVDAVVCTSGWFHARTHLRASLPGTVLHEGRLSMPHDPIRVVDTRAWLPKADMDLRAAAHELTAAPPFTADAVFHAQQAAEKATWTPYVVSGFSRLQPRLQPDRPVSGLRAYGASGFSRALAGPPGVMK